MRKEAPSTVSLRGGCHSVERDDAVPDRVGGELRKIALAPTVDGQRKLQIAGQLRIDAANLTKRLGDPGAC